MDNEQSYIIDGRKWEWTTSTTDTSVQLWVANYIWPDGDGVELYIDWQKEQMWLLAFSGIGSSHIHIEYSEFRYFMDKIPTFDIHEPFQLKALRIADYLCRIFCEYREPFKSSQ